MELDAHSHHNLYNVSVVVPVLNEEQQVQQLINRLRLLQSEITEDIIIVDGGSHDKTRALLSEEFHVIASQAGRAKQMNAGALEAKGAWIFFLHADTDLRPKHIKQSISDSTGYKWGRFNVRFDDKRWPFLMIAFFMNWRSRLTGIATGDQCIFIRQSVFKTLGGYSDIPLMEDIDISKRLKRYSKPACIQTPIVTSARRWQQKGIIRTIFLMWKLRFLYWLGKSPEILAKEYRS
ncbi:glycosyltransferase family 2 protein [Bermanella marisrubri]|uniref:Glycosyltransferase involved in cell wall biogenesis n=2 Tax=Bermanella marisrubri TaxID=207949 RepID=Q1N313_9GAMM|nr:Glycosyltransferase involved in cell wall biogenesis [Oceanobacter sp. RED65] [Bermanella marisrubri]QIZ85852.1 glycosyltransferase family 2 protein [Bermanella marisrubri]